MVILAAGLTPAWQQVMQFERFTLGEVNRAHTVTRCASGKVLNVAVALAALGAEATTLALVGGPPAESIEAEFAAAGLRRHWVRTAGATRVCTTILEADGRSSELVENAGAATVVELAQFAAAYADAAAGAEIAIITGSLPAGAPSTYYRDLVRSGPARLILDIRGPELLHALELRPLVVKPNRHELSLTVGRPLAEDDALVAAIAEIRRRGAEWVVVTDGAAPVWIAGPGGVWRAAPPKLTSVNPIGAGDCLAAGMAWALGQGIGLPEAVRHGVAAAAASVTHVLPGRFAAERIPTLVDSIALRQQGIAALGGSA